MEKLGGLALVAAVLLLAGCSSAEPAGDDTPTVDSAPSPTASQEAGITLDELRADYRAAGGQCGAISVRDTAVAEQAGDCDGGALLTTYASTAQRDAAINVLEGLQATNPSPHVIAVGENWIVNGRDAAEVSSAMGGTTRQIGEPVANANLDLSTAAGICEADAQLTNLELNDALAPTLGYPADRDSRTATQDATIRDFKNLAFSEACPERMG